MYVHIFYIISQHSVALYNMRHAQTYKTENYYTLLKLSNLEKSFIINQTFDIIWRKLITNKCFR